MSRVDMEADIEELQYRVEELVKALKYCELSTRPDGQWADQAVNSFVITLLAKVRNET